MILRLGEYIIESLMTLTPLLVIALSLTAGIMFGGFVYKNHREKTICNKQICRLEKKLEKLKTKVISFSYITCLVLQHIISQYQFI